MNIAYENIYLEHSKSLKIESYTYSSLCSIINWHFHPEYEIVFVRNGNGNIRVDSFSGEYSDGLLIFLGPNIPHMPLGNKQFKNNIEVVIQFPESFIKEKLAVFPEFESIIAFIEKSKQGIIFSAETQKKLSGYFLKFKNQTDTQKLLNFTQILYQLSIANDQKTLIKKNYSLDSNKQSLERISKVYQYVNDNYDKEIRSEIVANTLGLTPNSFCRMFKASTSTTFIDFLNEFRVKKAQELFQQKDITVSEVMYQCGFNDPSYFSKQFKKYSGTTPTIYSTQIRS
ncbi:AraC family transcriptional regulator [Aquimarina sp. MMG016]|uniref:AraC family transcriptional regulator n=1 Tax=Aquimarina sp. MMG016 TaxID=2822690 RepID=UPI001B3A62BB|nr:AraC family transcriptional regulator [Aquimarina sp. MMG016]MBQ4822249.1 helix-turn-helix domain-containing protein [Aquimarina sp. MMG016]